MDLQNKVVIITGGGSGIGRATAKEFADAGAKLVIADLSEENARKVAEETNGIAIKCDVTKEDEIKSLIEQTESTLGPVDLFFSNAGLGLGEKDHAASAPNDVWQLNWDIHVMSHVFAARALLPKMIERGDGYLLNMASAAGLLNQIGDAAYTATKHAAVAFAESLAITHKGDGVKVSVVCPQYVATPLTGFEDGHDGKRGEGTITAADAAKTILEGVQDERFMILPHAEVSGFYQMRAAEPEKWLSGMRKLRQKIIDATGGTTLKHMQKFL